LLVRPGSAEICVSQLQGAAVILKRYGARLQSVDLHFDPIALNEIGFRKSNDYSVKADEFDAQYQLVDTRDLTASAEGRVQNEAEAAVLASLEEQVESLRTGLRNGQILVVESEAGRDYPKVREKVTTHVVEGENRLHFLRTVDPPLRIGIYAPRST
jgi:hypothetical protein